MMSYKISHAYDIEMDHNDLETRTRTCVWLVLFYFVLFVLPWQGFYEKIYVFF